MKKLKWFYRVRTEKWYSSIFKNSMVIYDPAKRGHDVTLFLKTGDPVGPFKRLATAKKVAQLIHNG